MIVALMLDKHVLEARLISEANLHIDGYFEGLKQDMIESNEDVLDLSEQNPVFKIVMFPDKKPDSN